MSGPYCAACGQKNLGTRLSLGEVLWEFFSEVFEVEGKLPRTIVSLLFQPGRYLGEYLQGKRASYSSPLRFYLLATFVAVLVVGTVGERAVLQAAQQNGLRIELAEGGVNFVFAPEEEPVWFQPVPVGVRRMSNATDEALPWLPVCLVEEPDLLLLSLESDRTLQCPPAGGIQTAESLVERLLVERTEAEVTVLVLKAGLDWVPLALSLLVLWTTLLLKLLWWRGEATVHLITAVALHGMVLWVLVIDLLFPSVWVALALSVWFGVQVLFGLKRAYGSGWPRTILSLLLLTVPWSLGFACCFVIAIVLGLYQLKGLV